MESSYSLMLILLGQEEPKRIAKALSDPAWVEAMNKKDKRGHSNKEQSKSSCPGIYSEEGIDYDEVFAHVARIEAIRFFLAYASFMGFMVSKKKDRSDLAYQESKRRYFACTDEFYRRLNFFLRFANVRDMLAPNGIQKKPFDQDSGGYLKGNLNGGLWYPRNSPFDLVAYSDSDYVGASLDRKSTTGGCQFLGCKLISWQCKKQTIVDTSSTEAEYVAAASYLLPKALDVGRISTFWQTASASTFENGDMEITTTIDQKVKVVSEASIRRHLKLDNSDGISTFPTIEIFEQLALMGSKKTAWEQFSSNIETETEVPQPSSPTQTHVADEAASTCVDDKHGGAATIVSSLEAGQGSGNIHKTPIKPHDSPLPRVHTLGSDEDRMQPNELMELVTKLSDRVVVLENDLKQTKKAYGAAFAKLIKKVKTLEKTIKSSKARRRAQFVISHDEKEDSFNHGRKIAEIDEDPDISLVQQMIHHDAQTQGRQEYDLEPNFLLMYKLVLLVQKPRLKYSNNKKGLGLKKLKDYKNNLVKKRGKGLPVFIKKQHMGSHTLQQLRRYSFDEIKVLFEATVNRVNTFTLMESDTVLKVVAESSKGSAEEELGKES
ncbi:hypothetical protein Tco_0778553 [Tanacetum coccineum]